MKRGELPVWQKEKNRTDISYRGAVKILSAASAVQNTDGNIRYGAVILSCMNPGAGIAHIMIINVNVANTR